MKFYRRLAVTVMVASAMAGCASSTDSADSWSETYLAPLDRVFEAVIDVLEDQGYFVDADRASGRIVAEPPRGNRGPDPALAVRVVEKEGRARVDVQTRSGINEATTRGSRIEGMVVEFFHDLGARLREAKD